MTPSTSILDEFETLFSKNFGAAKLPRPAATIHQALEDVLARRYRSITFTEDGTCIIVDAETGLSASGATLADARASLTEKERLA